MSGEAVRGCLECTDWQDSGDPRQNIHEYTAVVTSYIHFCEALCVPSRRVKVFPNNKPWFSPGLRAKLKAFKTGDRASYKKTKYDVQ